MWTSKRYTALEQRLDQVEKELHELRTIPLEWEDWLHKIRNVLSRLNRRAERDQAPIPQDNGVERPTANPAALRLLGIYHPE